MTSVDVNFIVIEGGTGIGPRCRGADGRLTIVFDILVAFDPFPGACLYFEDPAVGEARGLVGVTSVDEDVLHVFVCNGYMLSSWSWERLSVALKFGPPGLLYNEKQFKFEVQII